MGKRRRDRSSSSSSSSTSSKSSSSSRRRSRYRKTISEKDSNKRSVEKSSLNEGRHKRLTPDNSSTRRRVDSQHSRSIREGDSYPKGNEQILVHIPNDVTQSDTTESLDMRSSYEERIKRLESIIRNMPHQSSNTSRLTVQAECIPQFYPENDMTASQWLQKIEQLKNVNCWDDITTIYHMQSRLAGMARTWYHSLTSVNHTWEEWKSLITRTFPDHVDFAETGKNAVSCIIEGIPDLTIQNAAQAGRYETPEALFEQYLSNVRQGPTPSRTPTYKHDFNHRRPREHNKDLRNVIVKRKGPNEKGVSNITCFNCKKRGHVQSMCPEPRITCTKCHYLGHTADQCRVPSGRLNKGNASRGREELSG